jgi:small-conductance mechanosensitive channel
MKTLTPYLFKALYASLVVVGAFILWRLLRSRIRKFLLNRAGSHVATVTLKLISYLVVFVVIFWTLSIFGVSLGALFTALGLFSVAVGFAAQTSVSNLISGFFLLFDRPFQIGDAVDIGGQAGIVLSIDLLSTKLRTFDNILVRIPNEKVLKSTIKNFVRFDIRRMDVVVGISYSSDISKAKSVIEEYLAQNPLILAEPAPVVLITELGESSVNLKILAWAKRTDFFAAKSSLVQGIKEALDKAGIEIPFPQVVVHMPSEEKESE